ncbi:MAG TPA: hypothetical protein VF777_09405 [Phycisphaerales bacterium]
MYNAISWMLALCLAAPLGSAGTVVFSDTFDGGMPPAVTPGQAAITPVQFFAGLGPSGYTFGGSFLRSPTGNTVTVTLSGLPPHSTLDLDFLFAAIDSLDGTGTFPEGDFFNVKLDGVSIFRESFANATAAQDQTYVAPPGGVLARRWDLGFSGPGSYYTDSAYDMSLEPRFHNLAHSASTATITFTMEGPGIQDLNDESWAIDNLRISVDAATCVGDLNADTLVDDADFQLFVGAYNILDCADPAMPAGCPADFNTDAIVDDLDFQLFAVAYDQLICP